MLLGAKAREVELHVDWAVHVNAIEADLLHLGKEQAHTVDSKAIQGQVEAVPHLAISCL